MFKRRPATGLALNFQNSLLPLFQSVVFVDWHGVLSKDVFWSHVLNKSRHPLFKQVTAVRSSIFSQNTDLISAWMKGLLTTTQVILEVGGKQGQDALVQSLIQGCKKASVDYKLLSELQKIRSKSFVVLATDNMDCFFENIDHNRIVSEGFDSLLCSSKLGVLKSDDPERFFKPWLDHHRLHFSDALLLDDSEENCRKFEVAGGRSLLVKSTEVCISDLQALFPGKH
ncbi:hypothetical protein BH20ACI2_BH20ACI2_02220 [soil metagenome]